LSTLPSVGPESFAVLRPFKLALKALEVAAEWKIGLEVIITKPGSLLVPKNPERVSVSKKFRLVISGSIVDYIAFKDADFVGRTQMAETALVEAVGRIKPEFLSPEDRAMVLETIRKTAEQSAREATAPTG
jgi:hypothetical protein